MVKMSSIEEKYKVLNTTLKNIFNTFKRNKSLRYGLPFFLFVVGGSFGLREWAQIRYQVNRVKGVSRDEAKKMGLNKEKDVTLESAFEEIKTLDIDNWENKRGPRPWEIQEQQKEKKK